jgi:hypothetical protein
MGPADPNLSLMTSQEKHEYLLNQVLESTSKILKILTPVAAKFIERYTRTRDASGPYEGKHRRGNMTPRTLKATPQMGVLKNSKVILPPKVPNVVDVSNTDTNDDTPPVASIDKNEDTTDMANKDTDDATLDKKDNNNMEGGRRHWYDGPSRKKKGGKKKRQTKKASGKRR